jgi:transcriptional regulator with XRE-family HTH domain
MPTATAANDIPQKKAKKTAKRAAKAAKVVVQAPRAAKAIKAAKPAKGRKTITKKTPPAKAAKPAKTQAKKAAAAKGKPGRKAAAPPLSQALTRIMATSGLSRAAIARQIGVSDQTFRSVLTGKRSPNARSLTRYAKLLDVAPRQMKDVVAGRVLPPIMQQPVASPAAGKGAPSKATPRQGGRKAIAMPVGKMDRKADQAADLNAIREQLHLITRATTDAFSRLAQIETAASAQADPITGDALALQVHRLPRTKRAAVASVLAALG